MSIEGIIFDSDGTLVDSEILSARTISQILQAAGAAISAEEVLARFRGCHFAVFAQALLTDFPVLGVAEFTQSFRQRTIDVFASELQPMPGALEVVSTLAIEKCVASNGPREKIETCLGVTGLLPHFAGRIASAYEVQSWKPDPGLILHAAAMMGIPAARCLLVEDSLAGVQAGLSAGVRVVGYRLDAHTQAALGRQVPVIQELSELHALLRAG